MRKGKELLTTGTMNPMVENPEEYFALGEMPSDKLIEKFEEEFATFDTVESILPNAPDLEALNELLLEIRRIN
jgi:hypothetical protein